ncbi:MAG: DUF1844 domain-containing protein [Novipirellula sp. JB048]
MSESKPNPEDPNAEEPKIIVDSDWKEQVAKEKEAAASAAKTDQEAAENETAEPAADAAAPLQPSGDSSASDDSPSLQPPPPASFEVLISMLFTQAMATLGQIPDPSSGEAKVNKPFAKHYIDTLDLLGEKTKGNLSEEESKMLAEALHALRMMYVNTK